MKGNNSQVQVDLNYPPFLDELLSLDIPQVKKVIKSLKKIRGLTWNQLFLDEGLNWEEVKNRPNTYTIRLSKSYRAVVLREASYMRFQSLHLDHDSAYGVK